MNAAAKQTEDLHLEEPATDRPEYVSVNQESASSILWVSLLAVLLAVLYAPTMAWLLDRWTLSVWHHAHGLLILPIVGYLIWQELRSNRHLTCNVSPWGFVIFVPALIIQILDGGMNTQLLSAFSLFLMLPGLSLLFLGVERTKLIFFPLVFLFFTLPIPLVVTEPIHLFLRQIATTASADLVPRLGIPLYVESFTLHIPNGSLLVADACSGFSTLYAALAIACLVAYTCPDWRRRALVIVAAAPIAIAANIFRVVLLVVLVDWYGIEVLGTSWHTTSGLLTFAIALPIIFWLGHTRAPKSVQP
jgi:exosortase